MDELQIQREAALTVPNIAYLPDIPVNALAAVKHETVSLASVGALGSGFSSIAQELTKTAAQTAAQNGGSGLYYVNTMGKQMMSFNNENAFLGSLANAAGGVGGGQARMIPATAPINPTAVMMSAALAGISKKMDEIAALQQDIMDYLKQKELAKIIGNINVLTDISDNFKFNWDNEQYKLNKHNLVQTIRKEAEASMVLARTQTKKLLGSHKPNLAEALQTELGGYQMSLYQFAFSSYLEVMLLGNFNADYLNSTVSAIKERSLNWRLLYTECYNKIKEIGDRSVRSHIVGGLSKAVKGIGEKIADAPVISKSSLDEMLISGGERLGAFNEQLNDKPLARFIENSNDCTSLFADNISRIKKLCSEETVMLFDDENIYVFAAGE